MTLRQRLRYEFAWLLYWLGCCPTDSVGVAPPALRALVLHRDGHRCLRCGAGGQLQIDHVLAWRLGGRTQPKNLQVLCGECNRAKGMLFADYRSQTVPISQRSD
jgi:5-methylcytosine-specific restriction endonuclease McrA